MPNQTKTHLKQNNFEDYSCKSHITCCSSHFRNAKKKYHNPWVDSLRGAFLHRNKKELLPTVYFFSFLCFMYDNIRRALICDGSLETRWNRVFTGKNLHSYGHETSSVQHQFPVFIKSYSVLSVQYETYSVSSLTFFSLNYQFFFQY